MEQLLRPLVVGCGKEQAPPAPQNDKQHFITLYPQSNGIVAYHMISS